MSSLVCLGRQTITGWVSTGGRQFQDWSADYRLFAKERFDAGHLFAAIRRGILEQVPREVPLVVAMDDSLLRKRGRKIAGVGWRRDPIGPPFQTNLVWGQRFLQLSAALPMGEIPSHARMIPIDFKHSPTPKKPRKNAPPEEWLRYRRLSREMSISSQGKHRLHELRRKMDDDPGGREKLLWAAVDGRFTNGTVLKDLPDRTTLIGRVRKDTHLHYPVSEDERQKLGRRRKYGRKAPTPEELRQEESIPWQTVQVWAAGKEHAFRIKTLAPLLWRSAGADHNLRLIVIAPLAYRPSKSSRVLYRKPAYLICTDPDLPLSEILQAYVWRWDIEVNIRDEKQLLGLGQAQVRTAASVEKVGELIVAAYGMLLLAASRTFGPAGIPDALPLPKWRRKEKPPRASTQNLISHMRNELWGKALGVDHFSGFATDLHTDANPEKSKPDLPSAVLYAVNY